MRVLLFLLLFPCVVRADVVLDLSGVGPSTLIADRFTITCFHGPASSWGGIPVIQTWQIGNADVCLELLATSAPLSATRYPIYGLPAGLTGLQLSPSIVGLRAYTNTDVPAGATYGTNLVAGVSSLIEPTQGTFGGGLLATSAYYFSNDSDGGFQFVGGDSGSPTFVFTPDGQQALFGEHWARGGFTVSYDALVGIWQTQLETIMAQYGESPNFVNVPEPHPLALLAVVGAFWLVWARRRFAVAP